MGFHSHNCIGCNHPLISHWATNPTNDWMRDATLIHKDPSFGTTSGEYDGYGRIWYSEKYRETLNINGVCDDIKEGEGYVRLYEGEGFTTCVWHTACWMAAGFPTEWKSSPNAECQGYFFGEGEHDMECPLKDKWDAMVWTRSDEDDISLVDYDNEEDIYIHDWAPGFVEMWSHVDGGSISRAAGNPYGLCMEYTTFYLSDCTRMSPSAELDKTVFEKVYITREGVRQTY